uniref:Uncharacterized protein n=1 Tax=Oryza rufipogon TaxID=4529 RepID=A0A0E0P3Y4_ORYRU
MASISLPGEVEGLLKGLDAVGWRWLQLHTRWPRMAVAMQGPITVDGVRRLGIEVNVGVRFSSFHGVLDALASRRSSAASRSPPTSRNSLEKGVTPWRVVGSST